MGRPKGSKFIKGKFYTAEQLELRAFKAKQRKHGIVQKQRQYQQAADTQISPIVDRLSYIREEIATRVEELRFLDKLANDLRSQLGPVG